MCCLYVIMMHIRGFNVFIISFLFQTVDDKIIFCSSIEHNHLLLIGSCSNAIAKNITSVVVNQILDKEENVFRAADKKLHGLIREMKERGGSHDKNTIIGKIHAIQVLSVL